MHFVGIVVLYHPEHDVLDNIASYLGELERLYVFDNTENPDMELVSKIKKLPQVQYISFGDNRGIAYALNTALRLAEGYKFLLTMDQDSKFYNGMIRKYTNILRKSYENDNTVAMFAVHYEGQPENHNTNDVEIVERAITSGSVVNIDIAKKIGGFDENLFIDEIDHEFCYRARRQGYRVLCFNNIKLYHNLGNPVPINILGKEYAALNHTAVRKYYIFRNNIYIIKKYSEIRKYCIAELLKNFIKMVMVEPDKWKKIVFIFRGIRDAFAGRMGKMRA